MLPVTHPMVGAGVATGAIDASVAPAIVEAGDGVMGAAVGVAAAELQAVAIIAAAMASAPKRRVPLINSVSPLAGQLLCLPVSNSELIVKTRA
jgi:hypothetical protein